MNLAKIFEKIAPKWAASIRKNRDAHNIITTYSESLDGNKITGYSCSWRDAESDLVILVGTHNLGVLGNHDTLQTYGNKKPSQNFHCDDVPQDIIQTLSSRIERNNKPVPKGLERVLQRIGVQLKTSGNQPKAAL